MSGLLLLGGSYLAPFPVGADGWTAIVPQPTSKLVYVANSGSDSNDGLTTSTPVATLAKAKTLIRSGFPDWILLKKGDTWSEAFAGIGKGFSNGQPLVFTSYGTGARPILKTGVNSGFSSTVANGQFMAIVGLDLYNSANDPSSGDYVGAIACSASSSAGSTTIAFGSALPATVVVGMCILDLDNNPALPANISHNITSIDAPRTTITFATGVAAGQTVNSGDRIRFYVRNTPGVGLNGIANYLLIEDCRIRYYSIGVSVVNSATVPVDGVDYRIRRCIITDNAEANPVHGQGVFLGDQLAGGSYLVEECIFDHNGWTQVDNTDALSETLEGFGSTIFNHGGYLHDSGGLCNVTGCIIANSSDVGVQIRPGGTSYNNLFIKNAVAFSHGNVLYGSTSSYNVVLNPKDVITAIKKASATTAIGNNTLHFSAVPFDVIVGNRVVNLTNPTSIASSITVSGVTATTVVLSGNVSSGIAINDVIQFVTPTNWGALYDCAGAVALSSTVGPHNIFNGNVGVIGGPFMLIQSANASAPGTCHDNWFMNGYQSIQDGNASGLGMAYTSNHQFNMTNAPTTGVPTPTAFTPVGTPTIEAYDTSIGGPGTLAHFLAGCQAQSKDSWDSRYTAAAANNYIRGQTDVSIPLL